MKRSPKKSETHTAPGRDGSEVRGTRRRLLRFTVILGLAVMMVGALGCLIVLVRYDRKAARYDLEAVRQIPQASVVLDATGERMGYLHGENVGTPVELAQVSPYFVNALISREDSRFQRHHGIDHKGIIRAWLRNLREKRTVQGGSTLTMQLTRMTYGLTGRTRERKLLEMALSRRIEKHYSKEEILIHYLNRVFLGTGMNGIEQAAQGYFGKTAAELTLPESAMLAGVIRAPNRFSPFRNYDAALVEMRSTLYRMLDEGMISREEYEQMKVARPAVLPQEQWMDILRSQAKISEKTHLMQMVEDQVRRLFPSHVGVGGLTIHTTFDGRLQSATEQIVEAQLESWEERPGYPHPVRAGYEGGTPEYVQAAVAVVENQTGAIRALLGGRNFRHSEFNRATQARRPMGSIFKPLVYGTAFEKGLFPGVLINDAAIAPGELPWDTENWSPENADGTFGEWLPSEDGLIRSRNTMTVRVGEWAGMDNVLRMIEQAGLGSGEVKVSPPLYIGTSGASVLEASSAYTVFATGGVRHETHFIESVVDRDGRELFRHEDESFQVMSPGAAWLTSSILKRVVDTGGTASSLRELGFQHPAAGKTGTTNDFHDAWFVGYTSRLSAGVWVGLDQPSTIAKDAYGGRISLPIWREVMSEAGRIGYEMEEFTDPGEVIAMELCRQSGQMAHPGCSREGMVYVEQVPPDLIPRRFCRSHSR